MENNSQPINSLQQAESIIESIIQQKHKSFKIKVSPDETSAIRQEEGIPLLYFDQLSTISAHLHLIRYNIPNTKSHAFLKISPSKTTSSTSQPTINKVSKSKNVQGRTQTSIDGKNVYLLVIDGKRQYMWVYVISSKQLPINFYRSVLQKFKADTTYRTVLCDKLDINNVSNGIFVGFTGSKKNICYIDDITGSFIDFH